MPVGLGVALFAVGVGEEVGRARRAREAAERRAREEERGKAKEVVGKGGGRRWFGLVG